MKTLVDFTLPGEAVADIGTDHGFVPIDLIAENKVPFAIMTDINSGPLKKAQANLNKLGILKQFYELRQGNGLEPLIAAEVSTVIIAGMGGETIVEILSNDIEKAKSYKRFVLQPRKRSWVLRQWLFENGFEIIDEKLVKEDCKICEIIIAQPGKGKGDDFYLPQRMRKESLFPEFLSSYIKKLKIVVDNMANSEDTKDKVISWKERLERAERLKDEYPSD